MNFQDLSHHFEDNACTLDHIEEYRYTATNCISFRKCEVEDLSDYGALTIGHYCYELGISAPTGHEDDLIAYRVLRQHIRETINKIVNKRK